jgi:hypothetical protein
MIRCLSCGVHLDADPGTRPAASIAGQIFGDEYLESYFLCPACGTYTVEIVHDRFLGEEEISTSGPLDKRKGDELVRLILECPDPSDKKCGCEAHKRYFDGLSG